MTQPIIRAENVGKLYHLGAGSSLFRVLRSQYQFWIRNNRDIESTSGDILWALDDVSFEVSEGQVLGVMGRNGSGKSTLLKILSRITQPTRGKISIQGRVASLLEVGTGFHPDLTGRENIFLNGSLLGMTKKEIHKQLDEIVAFAEIDQFLDTPIKRYSSGMNTRLGFAVAAHLNSEIMIIDEVLAVGDAEFQAKCLRKMNKVANQGRTILVVSHNISTILSLCDECILLDKGELIASGPTAEVASFYQQSFNIKPTDPLDLANAQRDGNCDAVFLSARIYSKNGQGNPQGYLITGNDLFVELSLVAKKRVTDINVAVTLYTTIGDRIVDANLVLHGENLTLDPGQHAHVNFQLHQLHLKPGTYDVGIWMGKPSVGSIDHIRCVETLRIEHDPNLPVHTLLNFPGVYQCPFTHQVEKQASVSAA